jgi:hypothetical protein
MVDLRSGRWLVAVVALVLLLTGCGPGTSADDGLHTSPLGRHVSIPTSTLTPTISPTATSGAVPSPTPVLSATASPMLPPMQLVVLHTNDNWGETEPCG